MGYFFKLLLLLTFLSSCGLTPEALDSSSRSARPLSPDKKLALDEQFLKKSQESKQQSQRRGSRSKKYLNP